MLREIIMSLMPLFVVSLIVIFTFIMFIIIYPRREKSELVAKRYHKSFVNVFFREYWYWLLNPILKLFLILRISANMVTFISLVITAVASYFILRGDISLGGWILVLGSSLDMVDGQIARLTDTSSPQGAFFDSCADRYSEGLMFGSFVLYFVIRPDVSLLGVILTVVASIGSQMVSYTKARGEAVGYSTKKGLMQRPERLVIICFFTCMYPVFAVILKNFSLNPDYTLYFALGFIAIFTNITAVSRLIDIFRAIGNIKKVNE